MRLQIRCLVCLSVALYLGWGAPNVNAAGFGIFTHGAKALGKSDAVTAHNDTPSTIFFNSALINDLPGTQVEIGTTLIALRQDYISEATGIKTGGEDDEFFPSTLYLTKSLSDELSMGIGVFSPFGLATEWPQDWEGRYIATKSEMSTLSVNPVLSWRYTPDISLAAGVSFTWLDATLQNKLNMAVLQFPPEVADGNQKFNGDGQGVGYNLGLSARLNDRIYLGLSYRSAIDVTADGRVSTQLPAGTDAVAPLFPTVGAETKVTLPRQVSAGVAYILSPKATIEVGLRWEEWSSFDELRITFDRPIAQQSGKTTPRDWDDTLAINIGGHYNLTDRYALLLGFLFENDPIPGKTLEPAIPGSDSYLYTVGLAAKYKTFEYAISYGLQRKADRSKKNAISAPDGSTANGEYSAVLHLLGVSLVYRF